MGNLYIVFTPNIDMVLWQIRLHISQVYIGSQALV